jgi:hypothetical protein
VREGDQQEARGDIEAALGGIGAWNASWAVLLDRYADAIRADERSRLEGFRIAPQPSMSSDQVSDREISHGEGDEARREAAWNESRSRSHYGHWDSQDEFNEAQVDGLSATDYKEAMEQGLDMARDIGEDLLRAQRQLVRMREVLEAKGLWG